MIQVSDTELEQRIEELGQRQPIPVKKTTMAMAILREAVRDDRGKPIDKWSEKSRRFSA